MCVIEVIEMIGKTTKWVYLPSADLFSIISIAYPSWPDPYSTDIRPLPDLQIYRSLLDHYSTSTRLLELFHMIE